MHMPGVPEPPAEFVAEPVGDRPALPYDPFPVPPYRMLEGTDWRLWTAFFPVGPGYFLGHRPLRHAMYGLSRGDDAWMTLFPMEIESQWPHLQAASGHTLIGGMGMALMAYAVSEKPDVTKVTIVERDPEVADMAPRFANFDAWPHKEKVEIVVHDLLTYRAPDPVDFLYADIWIGYRGDPKVADMQTVLANNPAPRVGYWGQEIEAVDWAAGKGIAPDAFDAAAFQAFCEETGLPLIGLEEPDYPRFCAWAATNPAIGGAVPDPS